MFAGKGNGVLLILGGVFLATGLAALGLGLRYALTLRDVQRLQAKAAMVGQHRNTIQALANDAAAYGRRNPAIVPLLEAATARQKAQRSAPPAVAPAP